MTVILLLGAARALAADDFIEQCKVGEIGDALKVCSCISERISATDRSGALAIMRKFNAAAAAGDQVDPASVTPEMRSGLQAIVALEAQCLK